MASHHRVDLEISRSHNDNNPPGGGPPGGGEPSEPSIPDDDENEPSIPDEADNEPDPNPNSPEPSESNSSRSSNHRYNRRRDHDKERDNVDKKRAYAMKYLSEKANWTVFEGTYEEFGVEAFKYLQKLSADWERYMAIHDPIKSEVSERSALEIILPMILKEDEPRRWYLNERVRDNDIITETMTDFLTAFVREYIPPQTAANLKFELKNIKMEHYGKEIRRFVTDVESKLNDLRMISEMPSDVEMWEIMCICCTETHLKHVMKQYGVRNWSDLRESWNTLRDIENAMKVVGKTRELNRAPAYKQNQGFKNRKDFRSINYPSDDEGNSTDSDQSDSDDEITLCKICEPEHSMSLLDEMIYAMINSKDTVLNKLGTKFSKRGGELRVYADGQQKKKMVCYHCNDGEGHFVRDCPKLKGTGQSLPGAMHGTAEGFREGDDPSKRPKHYRDAIKNKSRKSFNAFTKSFKSKKTRRGQTHASRIKQGHIEKPCENQYHIGWHTTTEDTVASLFHFLGNIGDKLNVLRDEMFTDKPNVLSTLIGDTVSPPTSDEEEEDL